MKWLVCIYYTDLQNCFFIKYKDEYQKSKWTIECRIFISFIWSWSELWNRNNNNDFTKKLKLAWLDFVDYLYFSSSKNLDMLYHKTVENEIGHIHTIYKRGIFSHWFYTVSYHIFVQTVRAIQFMKKKYNEKNCGDFLFV